MADEIMSRTVFYSGRVQGVGFRYTAAARACPQFEPALDEALCEAIAGMPVLTGTTVVMVDVSASMDVALSGKSDLTRLDAAATLASIIPGDCRVFTFSNHLVEVPPRKGMAGVSAIIGSQQHGGTELIKAISGRDLPVIGAYVLLTGLAFVIVNLLADVSYALIDPRVRLGARNGGAA